MKERITVYETPEKALAECYRCQHYIKCLHAESECNILSTLKEDRVRFCSSEPPMGVKCGSCNLPAVHFVKSANNCFSCVRPVEIGHQAAGFVAHNFTLKGKTNTNDGLKLEDLLEIMRLADSDVCYFPEDTPMVIKTPAGEELPAIDYQFVNNKLILLTTIEDAKN